MPDESIQNAGPAKVKRPYNRRTPAQPQQPIAPNPHIAELEAGLVPLVNQRFEANRKVAFMNAKAVQANAELQAAQGEFQQLEAEISYRSQLIGQMKNGGIPVPQVPYVAQNLQQGAYPGASNYGFSVPPSPPYTPVIPYPAGVPAPGVSSFPAPNHGLYPDAAPRGYIPENPDDLANTASATDFRAYEMKQRGQ